MLELRGKYAEAKVFTDVVDSQSISQVIELLNQPYAENAHVRMMPDIHAGAGCTIGTTMHISDKVCPNLVGVDIGCGMEVVRIAERDLDLELLDHICYNDIPSGFSIRDKEHPYVKNVNLSNLNCKEEVDMLRAVKSVGTLGGGNHFIEANKDDDGNIYIVVHSGSRHLGLEIANFYQDAGYRELTSYSDLDIQMVVEQLKSEGRHKDIEKTIKAMKSAHKRSIVPKPLAYVEGELLHNYLHDMGIAQEFAKYNRKAIIDTIVKKMGLTVVEQFTTIHNYIDLENKILRKGAVSAQKNEILLIPINMRDGSLICRGKGNPEWNCSAPHGAGRLMSRSAAKQAFTVGEFERQMEGIYTTSVGRSTLDECPMAYKNMSDIVENIVDTVEILKVIKPIYNFKAGGD